MVLQNRLFSLWPLFLGLIIVFAHSLLFWKWLIDDAGITFAYAHNFINGYGLVSQPGMMPTEGFSNPSWTFLISPIFLYQQTDPTSIIKVLSLLLITATFYVVHKISLNIFSEKFWQLSVSAFSLISLAITPGFIIWTTSGLENPLYAFLIALLSYQLIRYTNQDSRWLVCGIISGLLALTRPDGILFTLAFPLVCLLQLKQGNDKKLVIYQILKYSIITGLVIGSYLIFRYIYFDDILPNTYYAKVNDDSFNRLRLFATFELFQSIYYYLWPLILAFFIYCYWKISHLYNNSKITYLLIPLAISLAIFFILPNDWMGEFRFATGIMVLFYVCSISAVALYIQHYKNNSKPLFLAICIALILISGIMQIPRSFEFSKEPTIPFEDISKQNGFRFNQYAKILNLDYRSASLLTPDLGGTLYFSKLAVYDIAGLCDKNIALAYHEQRFSNAINYILEVVKPSFIHTHGVWLSKINLLEDPRFKALYSVIHEKKKEGQIDGDYVLTDLLKQNDLLEELRSTDIEKLPKTLPFPRAPERFYTSQEINPLP